MKPIGEGRDRSDGVLKVTGAARYATDTPVDSVTYAWLVTSTIARGKIASIDVGKAKSAPGVLAVITHENAPRLPKEERKGMVDRALFLLQDDEVKFDRQPIAIVVADTIDHARYAASVVAVKYDAAKDVAAVIAQGSPSDFPQKSDMDKKDAKFSEGDAEKAFASAAARIEATYSTPVEVHVPMERHATIAVWQSEKALTLYDSTQGVFETRRKVAACLGIAKEDVRVVSPFVGGGFGSKGSTWSHVVLAAMAAKVVGRPVKLSLHRSQSFGMVGMRPATVQKVSLAAAKDGALVAMTNDALSTTSRFDEWIERVTEQFRQIYACPNIATSQRIVRLDVGTPTQMRAPGQCPGNFALECAMDELSYALKMDPIALRLKNYADVEPETKKPWSSKTLKECYARGAEAFGWKRRSADPRSMRDGNVLIGYGMATASYPAHVWDASASARIEADGKVTVRAGSQDIGTGTYTILGQIAADALGVSANDVKVEIGDTECPESPTSGGSTTAASVGSAVKLACDGLKKKLADLAVKDEKSPLHGAKSEEVVFAEGKVSRKGDGAKGESLAALVARAAPKGVEHEEKAKSSESAKKYATRSFGAAFAEVRVDEALGVVRLARAVGAYAAGRILNAKTARSQYLGGMVWGVGMALTEEVKFDPRRARVMNADFSEYLVPVEADVRGLEVIMIEEDDPHVNAIGVKGIGEIGITGLPAAIANAVFHATGKRVRDLPITLEKLL